ncbi:hypothetical protein I302_108650 [Kwoniella bestiolae CBS 10118]|uniref:Uncharacterized protein n=1 Tax=Kwoniella bestiolae CBS 10118 TaxID=1296100 RepID=A0A1B9FTP6_9TREE|nr:hypothetical protein I302_07787 [Kwoniella bestiolae CBS 10118]OCF22145.1 hypothetical protein I302_07787 [Kwoniella bestiolae CBS 10118]
MSSPSTTAGRYHATKSEGLISHLPLGTTRRRILPLQLTRFTLPISCMRTITNESLGKLSKVWANESKDPVEELSKLRADSNNTKVTWDRPRGGYDLQLGTLKVGFFDKIDRNRVLDIITKL